MKRKWNSLIIEFLVFSVTFLLLIGLFLVKKVYPFGGTEIAYGDLQQTTIPMLYYAWDIWHGKANPFFTWRIACGANIYGIVSYWSVLSPFNFPLLFVQREKVYLVFGLLCALKIALMASSMSFYARKTYGVNIWMNLGVSIGYAFCAGILLNYTIWFMYDAAILVPLLMYHFNRISSDNKKDCCLFSLVLALILIINVYIGIMILLWLGTVLLVCVYVPREINYIQENVTLKKQTTKTKLSCTVIHILLAMLLSSVFTIPAIIAISNSTRFGEGGIYGLIRTYLSAIKNTNREVSPVYYAGLAVFLVPSLLRYVRDNRKAEEDTQRLVIVALMLLASFIPGIELLWHGGSRILYPLRFGFLLCFSVLDYYLSVYKQNERAEEEIEKKSFSTKDISELILTMGILCFVIAIYKLSGRSVVDNIEIIVISESLIIGAWLFYEKNGGILIRHEKLLLLVAGFVCEFMLFFAPQESYTTLPPAPVKRTETEGIFERTKDVGLEYTTNYALVSETNSIENYIGTLSEDRRSFFDGWGYGTIYTRVLDTGGTAFTDAVLGECWIYNSQALERDGDNLLYKSYGNSEYECNCVLPGFMKIDNLHSYNAELEAEQNVFNRQNMFACVLAGEKYRGLFETVEIKESNTKISVDGKKRLYFYVPQESVQSDENLIAGITINGEEIVPKRFENTDYPSEYNVGIIDLGTYEGQTINLTLKSENNLDYKSMQCALMDISLLKELTDRYKTTGNGHLVRQGTASVEYMVENENDTTYGVSTVYDACWKCYVNGEKTQTQSLNGLLSVSVPRGKNSIKLVYVPKGLVAGLAMSALTILLAIILYNTNLVEKMSSSDMMIQLLEGLLNIFGILMFVAPTVLYLFNTWG